jgi:hypothetical protein
MSKKGIIKLHRVRKEAIARLVGQVKAKELTVDEAAASLAGAQLKVFAEFEDQFRRDVS